MNYAIEQVKTELHTLLQPYFEGNEIEIRTPPPKVKADFAKGTDDLALEQGYIAITPLQIDQTNLPEKQRLDTFHPDFNRITQPHAILQSCE